MYPIWVDILNIRLQTPPLLLLLYSHTYIIHSQNSPPVTTPLDTPLLFDRGDYCSLPNILCDVDRRGIRHPSVITGRDLLYLTTFTLSHKHPTITQRNSPLHIDRCTHATILLGSSALVFIKNKIISLPTRVAPCL